MGSCFKRTKTYETIHSQFSDAHVKIDLNKDEPIKVPRASFLMGRDQAKRKGKGSASSSSDIEKMTSKMDELKATLEQYSSVAKDKEKSHDIAI